MRSEEHLEQVALIQWADYQRWQGESIGADLFAIPNGGDRHPVVAAKLKAEGVRRGVPDLMLAIPLGGYAGLFVEMKKRKGGVERPAQREWRERLTRRGYLAVVCHGWLEARAAIERYLALAGAMPINGAH